MTGLALQHPGFQREQRRYRILSLAPFPDGIQRLASGRFAELDRSDYVAANLLCTRITRTLRQARAGRAFDEEHIRACAERYSRQAAGCTGPGREALARHYGIPAPSSRDPAARAARLADVMWWRRQLRKHWTRKAEGVLRELGLIRRGREPYSSNKALQHRHAQRRRWLAFLQSVELLSDTGERLALDKIAERSLANPRIRRAEFMVRVRGFERIAADLGHVAEFVTLTAPSAFHAELSAGGANPAFERKSPRDGQEWLSKMWARARARMKRKGVLAYGFRIAEPHHDATPHWHLLLFLPARDVDTLRGILTNVWLRDYAHEPGASQHRVRFESIDPARGSATGYLAKYVAKNIDAQGAIGEGVDRETGNAVRDDVPRVDAWASVHRIRQFQQLGGPPVGLYREARRLRAAVADPDIERARRAADRGDWRGFVQAVGGILAGRHTNLKLERVETGELSRYGEPRAARVIGLRCASSVVITRPSSYRLVRRCDKSLAAQRPKCSRKLPYSYCHGSKGEGEKMGNPNAWTNPNETSQAGPP